MLSRFQLRNFKSFKDATLEFGPLTVLIGANASGKSNLIEALQLYSWLASGRRVDHVFFAMRDREIELRGGPGAFTRFGSAEPIHMTAELDEELDERHRVSSDEHQVSLLFQPDNARIVGERHRSLFPEEGVTFETAQIDDEALPRLEVIIEDEGVAHRVRVNDQQLAICQRWFGLDLEPQDEYFFDQLQKGLSAELQAVTFIDPIPKRMRGYAFNIETSLKSDCANVSAVLHKLCSEAGVKDSILEFIGAIPEKDVIDISFVSTPRSEVMVQLVETFGHREAPMDASVLSDGTLRVLAIAAAVLSVPENSALVIEEIDNGVHPSRVGILLKSILEVATRRRLHVLITTHSPALLDALPDAAIPSVQVCYRDPEEGDSRVIRLDALGQYPELVAQGRLGGLVSKGVLERYLKTPAPSRDERVRSLNSWLEGLGGGRPT